MGPMGAVEVAHLYGQDETSCQVSMSKIISFRGY